MKMKITLCSKKLGASMLALGFLSMSGLHAAQTPLVIEAEDASVVNYADVNTSYSGFSGGKGLAMLAAHGGTASYEVTVNKEGTYDLAIDYATMQERYIYVKVNNQVHSVLTFDDLTGDWNGEAGLDEEGLPVEGIKTKTIQIYLLNGENVIELGAFEGYSESIKKYIGFSPNIDKFTITESATQIQKPVEQMDLLVYEAEAANEINSGKISDFSVFSGGKGVNETNSAKDSYILFRNVIVEAEGTYDLTIYYATVNTRQTYVKVNNLERVIRTYSDFTNSWGDNPSPDPSKPSVYQKTIQVYLNQGANDIKIGAYGGWGPNLDKFEIKKAGLSISKPAAEVVSFNLDFTDLQGTEFTEQYPTNEDNLKRLFDNNENTFYTVPGVSSAQVVVKTAYPILLGGYTLATSYENPVDMEEWTVEYSVDGNTWTGVNVSNTKKDASFWTFRVNNNPASETPISAQYYRLTATGTTEVAVGEWQLLGVPYISAEKQFPEDITNENGLLTASDDGFNRGGTWNEVFENAIDKNARTKYTIVDKKAFWLQYEVEDAVTVASYSVSVPYTLEYQTRNPKDWKFLGYSADTDEWVTLDSISNMVFPLASVGGGVTAMFNVKTPTPCYAYKLDVVANNGGDTSHLLQWQMFTTALNNGSGINENILDPTTQVQVYNRTGGIVINYSGVEKTAYAIYNLLGQRVTTGYCVEESTNVDLADGLYIVRVAGKSVKVIVK